MLNLSIFRSVRHLGRYQEIVTIFARHGFGFVFSQILGESRWERKRKDYPIPESSALPRHFRVALEELGPTFVKLGQMLSTRPDLLPPEYLNELAKLQDTVPPVPWEDIRQVIEKELHNPPETIFRSIEMEPIAAASLGQVHAATLHSGEEVVVKVQRPNIHPLIRTDLEILQELATQAQRHTFLGQIYKLEEIAEEFADTLQNELNYQQEGRNADRFKENFKDETCLYIPHVYWEYTTKRVLVLEFIAGIKIDNVETLEAVGYDCKRIAYNAAKLTIKEVLEDGFFHADPHPGNMVVMENEVIGAMDFGMVGYLRYEDRQDLIRLYTVAVRMDVSGLVDELIHIGAAPPTVNRIALGRDVERLLNRYYNAPLKEISATELINEIMPLAFRHHLQFPSNLWLLGKTLAMMEGIGKRLSPDFDIFEFSKPYVNRLLLSLVVPNRRWAESAFRQSMVWNDLFKTIPRAGMILLNRLEKREKLPIDISIEPHSLHKLDQLVTRLSISVIVAGMIIGMGQVLPVTAGSNVVLQVVVISGFVIALLLGIWLLISIVRQ
ncbi:MAG: AarF/ABC1/UbiB kinase family protein [Anaerolineae bacterium]|nr:AarF/ABC1/UbiB kinase family protein [Anaerolineae bacterium]